MCGIFGIARTGSQSEPARARDAMIMTMLGVLSEERGKDASGIAFVNVAQSSKTATAPSLEDAKSPYLEIDNSVIVKDTKPFRELPLADMSALLVSAPVMLGHTRWATQGAADELQNASPLLAGSLIGTHNGDVEVTSIPEHARHTKVANGATDTELLYLAMNDARKDRSELTKVFRGIKGRAALAFVDRTRADRLYLARTTLSPLAYAYTADGSFVYASNPNWFRQIEKETKGQISFHDITLVPEGHLLTVDTETGDIEDIRRFTPTCRESDVLLINSAVYRCFTAEDKAADRAIARHKVYTGKLPKWPGLTPAPVIIDTGDEDIEPINEVELEALCWARGDFDHYTYNMILDADVEDQAELMDEFREEVEAAMLAGETFDGFVMPDPDGGLDADEPAA
jgi:glucosamine--fructose-6-phosphate aminotransferase (isomerizing)